MAEEQLDQYFDSPGLNRLFRVDGKTYRRNFPFADDESMASELRTAKDGASMFEALNQADCLRNEKGEIGERWFAGSIPADNLATLQRLATGAPEIYFDYAFDASKINPGGGLGEITAKLGRVIGVGISKPNGVARGRYNGETLTVVYVEESEDYVEPIGKSMYVTFRLQDNNGFESQAEALRQRFFVRAKNSLQKTPTKGSVLPKEIRGEKLTDPEVVELSKKIGANWSILGKIPSGDSLADGVTAGNISSMGYGFHDSSNDNPRGRYEIDSASFYKYHEFKGEGMVVVNVLTEKKPKKGRVVVQVATKQKVTTEMHERDSRLIVDDTDDIVFLFELDEKVASGMVGALRARPGLIKDVVTQKFGTKLGDRLVLANKVVVPASADKRR